MKLTKLNLPLDEAEILFDFDRANTPLPGSEIKQTQSYH